jgi:hypothetical protein
MGAARSVPAPAAGAVAPRAGREPKPVGDAAVSLAGVLLLAAVHVMAGRVHFVSGPPRARGLSLAGGITVAYLFVHLLPDIAAGEEHIVERVDEVAPFLERHAYLLALTGVVLFYGAERAAIRSRERQGHIGRPTSAAFFRVHLGLFAAYSVLVGYLLVGQVERDGVVAASLFVVALGVHFVVNDTMLRDHHEHRWDDGGRWILAGAALVGWAIALAVEVPPAVESALIALLGGGVILNVLKEELPAERDSRFWAFFAGAAGYATVLVLV